MPPKKGGKKQQPAAKGKGKGAPPKVAAEVEEAVEAPSEVAAPLPPQDITDNEPAAGGIPWRDLTDKLIAQIAEHDDIRNDLKAGGDLSLEASPSGDAPASYKKLAVHLFKDHPTIKDMLSMTGGDAELGEEVRKRVSRLVEITKSGIGELGGTTFHDEVAITSSGNADAIEKWETLKQTNPWFFKIHALLSSPATPEPEPAPAEQEGASETQTNHAVEPTGATLVDHPPPKAATPLISMKDLHADAPMPAPVEDASGTAKGNKKKEKKKKGKGAITGTDTPAELEPQQAETPEDTAAAAAAHEIDPWADNFGDAGVITADHPKEKPRSPLLAVSDTLLVDTNPSHDQHHAEVAAVPEEPSRLGGKKDKKGKGGNDMSLELSNVTPAAEDLPQLTPKAHQVPPRSPVVPHTPVPASAALGHKRGLSSLGGAGGGLHGTESLLDPSSAATGHHPHQKSSAPPSPRATPGDLLGLGNSAWGASVASLHPEEPRRLSRAPSVVSASRAGSVAAALRARPPSAAIIRSRAGSVVPSRAPSPTPAPAATATAPPRAREPSPSAVDERAMLSRLPPPPSPPRGTSPVRSPPAEELSLFARKGKGKNGQRGTGSGFGFFGSPEPEPPAIPAVAAAASNIFSGVKSWWSSKPEPTPPPPPPQEPLWSRAPTRAQPPTPQGRFPSRVPSPPPVQRSRIPSPPPVQRSRMLSSAQAPPPPLRAPSPAPAEPVKAPSPARAPPPPPRAASPPPVERMPPSRAPPPPPRAPSPPPPPLAVQNTADQTAGSSLEGKNGTKAGKKDIMGAAEPGLAAASTLDPWATEIGDASKHGATFDPKEGVTAHVAEPIQPKAPSRAPSPAPQEPLASRAPLPAPAEQIRAPSPSPRAPSPVPTPVVDDGGQTGSGLKGKKNRKGAKKADEVATKSVLGTASVLNPLVTELGDTSKGGATSAQEVEAVRSRAPPRVPSPAPLFRLPSRAPSPAPVERARTPSPTPRALSPGLPPVIQDVGKQAAKGKNGKKGGKKGAMGAAEPDPVTTSTLDVLATQIDDTSKDRPIAIPEKNTGAPLIEPMRSRAPSRAPSPALQAPLISREPSPIPIARARTPSPVRASSPAPPPTAEDIWGQAETVVKGKKGKKGAKKIVETAPEVAPVTTLDPSGTAIGDTTKDGASASPNENVEVPVVERVQSRVPSRAPSPDAHDRLHSRAPSPAPMPRARSPSPAPRVPSPAPPAAVEDTMIPTAMQGKKGKKGAKKAGGVVSGSNPVTVSTPNPWATEIGAASKDEAPAIAEEGVTGPVVEPIVSPAPSRVTSPAPQALLPSRAPSPIPIERVRTPSPAPRVPSPIPPPVVEDIWGQTGTGAKGKKGKKGAKKAVETPTKGAPVTALDTWTTAMGNAAKDGAPPPPEENVEVPLVEPVRSRVPSRAPSPALQALLPSRAPSPALIERARTPSPAPRAPSPVPPPVVEDVWGQIGTGAKGKKGKKGAKKAVETPAEVAPVTTMGTWSTPMGNTAKARATPPPEENVEAPLVEPVRSRAPSRAPSPALQALLPSRAPSPIPIERVRTPSPTPRAPSPVPPTTVEEPLPSAGNTLKGKKGKKAAKKASGVAAEPEPVSTSTLDPLAAAVRNVAEGEAPLVNQTATEAPLVEPVRSRPPSRAPSPVLVPVARARSPSPAPPPRAPSPAPLTTPAIEESFASAGKKKKGKKGGKNTAAAEPEPLPVATSLDSSTNPTAPMVEEASNVQPMPEPVRSRAPSRAPSPAPREPSPAPIVRARSPSPAPPPRASSPLPVAAITEDISTQTTPKNQKGKKANKGGKITTTAIEPESTPAKQDIWAIPTPDPAEPEATTVPDDFGQPIVLATQTEELITEPTFPSFTQGGDNLVDFGTEPAVDHSKVVEEEPPMRMPSPHVMPSALTPVDSAPTGRNVNDKRGKGNARRTSVSFMDEILPLKADISQSTVAPAAVNPTKQRSSVLKASTPITSTFPSIPESRDMWSNWQGEDGPKSNKIVTPAPEVSAPPRSPQAPTVVMRELPRAAESSKIRSKMSGSKDLGAAGRLADVMAPARKDSVVVPSGSPAPTSEQRKEEASARSSARRMAIPDPVITSSPLDTPQGSKLRSSRLSSAIKPVDVLEPPGSSRIRVPSSAPAKYVSREASPPALKTAAERSRDRRSIQAARDSSSSSSASSTPVAEAPPPTSSAAARRGITLSQLVTNISARPTSKAYAVRGSAPSSPEEPDRRRSILTVATKGTTYPSISAKARPTILRRVSDDAAEKKIVHCACCTVGNPPSRSAIVQRPSALVRRQSTQPDRGPSTVAVTRTALGQRLSNVPLSAPPTMIRRRSDQPQPSSAYAAQGRSLAMATPKEAPQKNNETFLQSAGKAFHGMKFRQVSVVEEDGQDGRWTVNILNEP
ncbi:hypothetical protein FRB95_004799 [Tulasnella sp. JGI-2019a]|nr:hypothetical protein FRB95_004799 [Tulasnella sp. JGI-2019a]